jgi:hypothetical protein
MNAQLKTSDEEPERNRAYRRPGRKLKDNIKITN